MAFQERSRSSEAGSLRPGASGHLLKLSRIIFIFLLPVFTSFEVPNGPEPQAFRCLEILTLTFQP